MRPSPKRTILVEREKEAKAVIYRGRSFAAIKQGISTACFARNGQDA